METVSLPLMILSIRTKQASIVYILLLTMCHFCIRWKNKNTAFFCLFLLYLRRSMGKKSYIQYIYIKTVHTLLIESKWWSGKITCLLFLSDTWELKHATRNISPTNNQANIVDLHPASVYSIRMYSYNAIGKSEASKELTISTEEARKCLDRTVNLSKIFHFCLLH